MSTKHTYGELEAKVSMRRREVIVTEKECHAGLQYLSFLNKRPIILK
jgi:hypothetical protein